MKSSFQSLIGIVGLLAWSASGAFARPVQIWSRAELWQKADLVVIATAGPTHDEIEIPNPKPETWIPVVTEFKISALLKGKSKKLTIIPIEHYRYHSKSAALTVIDGPIFISFDPKSKNRYLIFLTAQPGGPYRPLTGSYDPSNSFVEVKPSDHGTTQALKPKVGK